MWFVTVCAVYFSQFTPAALRLDIYINLAPWRVAATIGLAWVVLALFYFRHRLYGVLSIHCLVPATIATLSIGENPGSQGWWLGLGMVLIICALFVNVVCFPVAVVIMAALAGAACGGGIERRRHNGRSGAKGEYYGP